MQTRDRDTGAESKRMDKEGKEERWTAVGVVGTYVYTPLRVKQKTSETYCGAQGVLLGQLWWPKWEGRPKKRGDVCDSLTSLDSRN